MGFRNLVVATAILACVFAPDIARATEEVKHEVSFSVTGYYRLRGFWLHDQDNARRGEPVPSVGPPPGVERLDEDTEFWDMRLMLNPDLKISDVVHIRSQFRILDDFVWGGATGIPSGNPVSSVPDNRISIKRDGPGDEDDADFQVERAWADVKTPIGRLDFGRMGSHWGMGLFTNDGNRQEWGVDGLGDDRGDTVDRIKLMMKFDDVYVAPMFDRVSEELIDDGEDDIHQYILSILYKTDTYELGTYDGFREGDADDTGVYFVDLYGQARLPQVGLESELLYLGGETNAPEIQLQSIDIDALQWVIRADAEILDDKDLKIGSRLEWGWASGSEPEDFTVRRTDGRVVNVGHGTPENPGRRRIRQFGFHPDFDVDYLLFEHYVGNVMNAQYAKVSFDGTKGEDLSAFAQLVYGRAQENTFVIGRSDQRLTGPNFSFSGGMQFGDDPAENGSQSLGVEFDAGAAWRIERFRVQFVIAALFPGKAFDLTGSDRARSVDAADRAAGREERGLSRSDDDHVIFGSFVQAGVEF